MLERIRARGSHRRHRQIPADHDAALIIEALDKPDPRPIWVVVNAGSNTLGLHFWQPYEYSVEGQNEWLKEHVMKGHGALGELYPERRYNFMHGKGSLGFIEGGGTVQWLGLVNKGLIDIDHPSWGGWGGRFSAAEVACFWSRHGDIRGDEEKVAPFYVHREFSDTWTNPADGETWAGGSVPI